MITHALARLRAHPGRRFAVLMAIVIGTAFLAATAVFTATSAAGLRAVAAAPLNTADVVVDHDPESADPEPDWAAEVTAHPDVVAATAFHARTRQLVTEERRAIANVYSLAAEPSLRWFDLEEGRWPASPTEVVVDTETLEQAGLALGDRIRLRDTAPSVGGPTAAGTGEKATDTADDGTAASTGAFGGPGEAEVTVVGVTDLGFRPLTGVRYRLYATEGFFAGDIPSTVLARVRQGASPEATVADLNATLPPGLSAMTAVEQAELAADRFAGGSRQLDLVLLVFGLIALLAAGMVIAGAHTVQLARLRRDIALLRLVGARRGQVRGLIVTEAAVVGLLGSLLGSAAGVGLGYVGASLTGLTGVGLRVFPLALVGVVCAGVLTTVCAAWAPARRAAAVPPIEALRAADPPPGIPTRPVHLVGAAAALVGGTVMSVGALVGVLPIAIGAGFLGAVGLLSVLRPVLARLMVLVAPILDRCGGVAGLAGANLVRDPGRAATSALTLVLGLGLISALLTAATTGRATIDADLRNRYPVDVSVRVDTGSISPDTERVIADIEALTMVEKVRTSRTEITGLGEVTLVGVTPELTAASGAPALTGDDGTPVMVVSNDQLAGLGVASGQRVALALGGTERTFTVVTGALATVSGTAAPVVDARVLDTSGVDVDRGMVWGVARDDADRDALSEHLDRVAAADPSLEVGGASSERRDITGILDMMVNLALAMLLVTVLIATLGVADTLGLSVVERTRESALLRALGLTRAGLRGTLAVEAMVIALLGALLGVLIGVPYGLAGIAAVVGDTAPLVVAVPWAGLASIPVAALVIGIISAVLPARRAARTAPAAGLAA
ncbi:FtsX-like permease family protein [Nocardiopsis sp. N85]|uniref:FtsX-like permease family protein n=1 Tax=Nocardiopsis sp. N85 TaxID=3029400 RepID=UPI00237EF058|nr:FtsX-like permease family protein [Nocardiopsis sp. N85]MDE3720693.1 FtsX-like permease family protein [Nocardiopsis sp. N85]